jgi:Zn finger protein HypA/HybF involved in hydrogenase expression
MDEITVTIRLLPQVRAWLEAKAQERGSSIEGVLSDLARDAYAETLPLQGPCSRCGCEAIYVTLDLCCPACQQARMDAVLERGRALV